jgi:oligopeptide/dipeptide ABC transporter ATP-binding protein
VLRVENLVKHFPIRKGVLRREMGRVRAVNDVSFTLAAGETLGLVGESGCGKSTIGRCIVRLLPPTSGRVLLRDRDITRLSRSRLRGLRRQIQIVFQDPHASLNPRLTVGELVSEPLRIWQVPAEERRTRVTDLLERVGLGPQMMGRLPHELSGGQRQRVAIARSLALEPEVLVLDEPVSSLDVSVQAQVTGLLQELQEELGLAYLFISHDLSVVHHLSHRVAVMYLGRIVETGSRDEVFGNAGHPYTQALMSAVPVADPTLRNRRTRIILKGDVSNPSAIPTGCPFRTRCWKAQDVCVTDDPLLTVRPTTTHPVACHFTEPVDAEPMKSGPDVDEKAMQR